MPNCPHYLRQALCTVVVIAGTAGVAAAADSFNVVLGGRTLGTLSYDGTSSAARLGTVLDNTPLGVFDGRFDATSKAGRDDAGRAVQAYAGQSASTRKNRRISLMLQDGRALQTVVEPADERTNLSDPAKVPGGVLDPARAFGTLVSAKGCPGRQRIYDGRRVTELRPTGSEKSGNLLTCKMDYKVIAGPGHLSPLRLTSFDLVAIYDMQGGQTLREVDVRSGIFKLQIQR